VRIGWATVDWSQSFADETGQPAPGGSGWYRCHLPAQALAKLGHTTFVGRPVLVDKSTANPRYVIADMKIDREPTPDEMHEVDVVVFQRCMHRAFADDLKEIEDRRTQLIVNDVDDNFWQLDRRNHAYKMSLRGERPDNNIWTYLEFLQLSDVVTVSTPYLAEYLGAYGCNTQLVRNGVDLDRWHSKNTMPGESPVLGWVGALPWRSGDIETLRRPLRLIEQTAARFYHGGHIEGAATFADKAGLRSAVMTAPMTTPMDVHRLYFPIDVGIVPLNQIPFNEAKSFIKGLEYAASGIPFVAQSTGEYDLLAEGGIGEVARNDRQWSGKLKSLLFDPEAYTESREKARANLAQHDISKRAVEWQSVFR